jgi:hypothetical protein
VPRPTGVERVRGASGSTLPRPVDLPPVRIGSSARRPCSHALTARQVYSIAWPRLRKHHTKMCALQERSLIIQISVQGDILTAGR